MYEHSTQEVSGSLQKELWTTAQAAVLPVKGCYQDPLFASGIRPPVVVCGSNMMSLPCPHAYLVGLQDSPR